MLKRLISILLAVSLMIAVIPAELVSAGTEDSETVLEISNRYIKVIVNKENGGYVISTVDGDILKKSDDNVMLTHRGENFDTSFTSFKVENDEYIFGENADFPSSGSANVVTQIDPGKNFITSTWSIGDFSAEQKISLVNNDTSEQLGTVMITYTIKNNSSKTKNIRSRILIDTRLGENDYGYYEVPNQKLGQGYEYFEFEKTLDSYEDQSIKMPSDYFVRDNKYSSSVIGYGVNSVFEDQKPYKMTFAHWENIASTVFDYTPDEKLNFTNNLNDKKTADSAVALYYDLGNIASGEEKSFSTYYGVTANLKNKDNKIIINTTSPSKLSFKDGSKTAYKGSDGTDNVARINVNLTNPLYAKKDYKDLAVVVYALGFETQRQTDKGNWIVYDNNDPIYTDIPLFKSGENHITYFDFKFEPKDSAQLGTFVVKVFNMDKSVNSLGSYAEEFCLGTTENHIILPGKDANLPAITLTGLAPDIIYNRDIRYMTVSGRGTEFFKSELLNKIELRGDNGKIYNVPIDNLVFDNSNTSENVSIMLDEYMEPGRYKLHFLWKSGTGEKALDGVPNDFTSDSMVIQISNDLKYSNSYYGVVTIQRDNNNKYKVVPYKSETEFQNAQSRGNDFDKNLLLSFRGDISNDRANKKFYRLFGKDKDVNINHILNYRGDDLTIHEKDDGTVEILMDGKITTVGANTTVRNGTAAFRLNSGTEYIIPEYDSSGKVVENGELSGNKDFIELKWDNAFDILTTVGGFLIDLKYGVLGKIQNDDNEKTKSDIISFGGSLDLGFMTPGGAAAVRQNTAAGARWTTGVNEIEYDDMDDGYTFGLDFDEDSGTFKSQVTEKDIEPANNDADRIEAGAAIHDILYGGKNPGYIGINMDAHITLPQIVKFLPNKIEGDLSINTINGYEVGVNAAVEAANISMALSFVVKSSPSGEPIPDKLYFSIGGFEPGFNVDGLGITWITGGGGGLDNLYDTIYGKDGIPPLTLLLHVEFDITKILTGVADLELSLRSLKISFSDLSLKMLKDAKFLENGEIAVGWYPNFNLNLSAGVNFMQIMQGRFTITAAAGSDTADFVQFVLNVAISLPKYIPIVGGMELASAELGGGSEKVWGSVEMLGLIKVGFTYYWGGSIEFTHGNPSGSQNFETFSKNDDAGIKRTKKLFNSMLEPLEIGKDPRTGEPQFASVGGNLSYSAGSKTVTDFDKIKNNIRSGITLMSIENGKTEIITNVQRTQHLVSFGEKCDYILSISLADGSDLSAEEIKKAMSVKKDGSPYDLRYYIAPGRNATNEQKTEALKNANVNVSGNAAYIAIPKNDSDKQFLIEFSDGNAYDISAIKVNPISALTSYTAQINGNILTVDWDGENISDSAKIIISIYDGEYQNEIILNENDIPAKSKTAVVTIPDKTSSGEYTVKITLSDEDKCFSNYYVDKKITFVNSFAPGAAENVNIKNCGDDKLKVTVDTKEKDFDGYLVEIYENGKLYETGLYFDKDEEIIVGGRYEMPLIGENNVPTGKSVPVGYTPGKKYSAKVRLCNIREENGSKIYHCSSYKLSAQEELKASSRPQISLEYDKDMKAIKILCDVPCSGELYINQLISGSWEPSDKKTQIVKNVDLSDGMYTVEFFAEDEDGDHAIIKKTINVDTTPPVIMLSSPKSGDCFDGENITVTATADEDAEYIFKINGNKIIPNEKNIFENKILKCTLNLGDAKNSAKINLEIIAKDSAGNETVKRIVLKNKNLSKITSISILSEDKPVKDGKIILNEGESASLKVFGVLENKEKIDITDEIGTAFKINGGTSSELNGSVVTAKNIGQSLICASFALGGNNFLYDGVVIETSDNTLIYSVLEDVIAEAEKIEGEKYTDSSFNKLLDAITGAKQILSTPGITQDDINSAATAVADAIAGLEKKGSGPSGSVNAVYTVSFNTNGAETIPNQKVESQGTAEKPSDPTKDGYTFGGWYREKQLINPYDFSEKVTRSITLYAKWIKNQSGIDDPDSAKWENPFKDVNDDDWFFEYVKYVVKNKLFNGTAPDLFAPGSFLTRAMLVTVLWRADGMKNVDSAIIFDDVSMDKYYTEAIRWAASNGIVNGICETKFAPDNYITREQIAAVMLRYAKYKGIAPENAWAIKLDYNDIENISDWALEAVMFCKLKELMLGNEKNSFNPKNNASRAEAAAILQRFLETDNGN